MKEAYRKAKAALDAAQKGKKTSKKLSNKERRRLEKEKAKQERQRDLDVANGKFDVEIPRNMIPMMRTLRVVVSLLR